MKMKKKEVRKKKKWKKIDKLSKRKSQNRNEMVAMLKKWNEIKIKDCIKGPFHTKIQSFETMTLSQIDGDLYFNRDVKTLFILYI